MAEQSEDKLFQTLLERGKQYGYTEEKLTEYIESKLQEAQDRADRAKQREEQKELEKAKIEAQAEIAKIEAESKAQIERAKIEAESKAEAEKAEIAKIEAESKAEIERAKIEAESKAKAEAEKAEIEKLKIKADFETKIEVEREKTKQIQIQTDKLSSPLTADISPGSQNQSQGPVPRLPKLPTFKEKTDTIDSFLYRFEAQATTSKWPKEQWAVFLAAYLEGSALTLYHSLSEGNVDLTYDCLKENLLKKFSCTAEGFRSRFRSARPEDETFDIFAVELRRMLDRWVLLSDIDKSYEGLIDLLLREQLLASVSKDLATFLLEKDLQKFEDMINAAEAYRRAHPGKSVARKGETTIFGGASRFDSQTEQQGARFSNQAARSQTQKDIGRDDRYRGPFRGAQRGYKPGRGGTQGRGSYNDSGRVGRDSIDEVKCFNCGELGHMAKKCEKGKMVTCHVPEEDYRKFYSNSACREEEQEQCKLIASGAHVCSSSQNFAGELSLEHGVVNGVACSVLRDTGANVCGVRKRLVRDDQFLGKSMKCVSFGGRVEKFEMAEVEVDCDYFQKKIVCCVLDAPVADFIVGNVPDSSGEEVPKSDSQRLSTAAITQTRNKRVVAQKSLSQCVDVIDISKAELVQKQQEDRSLNACFYLAKSGKIRTSGSTSHFFHITKDVLYRTFSDGEKITEQVVVPKCLRPVIMAVSHDLISSGHCGAKRTLTRIGEKFYWPGVTMDVAKYIASCKVCQRTTPKGRVSQVPLAQVPLKRTPFHRVPMQNSAEASARDERSFDKKAREREFKVGDQVLVQSPSSTNKRMTCWLGPCPVTKALYLQHSVLVKGQSRVFHANMLQ